MFSPSRFLVITLVTISSVVTASWNSVQSSLKNNILRDCQDLARQVEIYPGTTPSQNLILIQRSLNTLAHDVDNITTDIKASPVPTVAQIQAVLDYLDGDLLACVKNLMTKFNDKKSVIVARGESALIAGEIKKLRSSFDNLLAPLIAKAPTAATANSAMSIKAKYDSVFNGSIAAYGGTP